MMGLCLKKSEMLDNFEFWIGYNKTYTPTKPLKNGWKIVIFQK